jgi:cytochrome c oxidase subunit 2
MHIDKLESAFLWFAGTMMAIFAGAVIISVVGFGIHLPGPAGEIDPSAIDTDPGFSNPGVRELREGFYEAYIVADDWKFSPAEIEVPVGAHVTFYLTSGDVIHGFKVFDTNLNITLIPGQISQVEHTFSKQGKYQFYCNEYCGPSHAKMTGVVTVTGANP